MSEINWLIDKTEHATLIRGTCGPIYLSIVKRADEIFWQWQVSDAHSQAYGVSPEATTAILVAATNAKKLAATHAAGLSPWLESPERIAAKPIRLLTEGKSC